MYRKQLKDFKLLKNLEKKEKPKKNSKFFPLETILTPYQYSKRRKL